MFNIINEFIQNNFDFLKKHVQKINYLENEISFLNENEIKQKINNLIDVYKVNQKFDQILHESFALTREASKRTLGLRHFDTQIMGGVILHEGKISEMKTGEGKTLVATLALILNALTLKGAHLVTVNDYLAKRDKQAMSKLYRYLGLSVGLITENMDWKERKKNYLADITYVTNSQLAFDYLKDNLASSINEVVLSDFNYCIIDEIDSILIDEARTPLIISGSLQSPIAKYIGADEISKYLQDKIHYNVDEKTQNVNLTNKGIRRVEKILNVSSLYNKNDPWIPFINNAIKAKIFYIKDVEYIVENNNILMVDKFTGRIMADRRWGDGLHEAIEAKENIDIKKSSETLSSITYQNFFLSYPKFAGMTGTAKTAEAEFESLYNLPVKVIPTNKKIIRQDLEDLIFINEFNKWEAIAQLTNELYILGRPVLIGTTNIKNSKIISELLKNRNIKHRLLNAKPENLKFESEIIAEAGERYAITVSTNMSGRGTDIILGGNAYYKTRRQFFIFLSEIKKKKIFLFNKHKINFKSNKNLAKLIILLITKELEVENILKKNFRIYENVKVFETLEILKVLEKKKIEDILINIIENAYFNETNTIEVFIKSIYEHFYRKNKKNCEIEKKLIKNLGGLYVIGTERHESRRIDNQLRGRAGRQGDPGTSRFFNSLDDNLLKIFGTNEIKKNFEEQNNINSDLSFLNPVLEKIQKNIEDYHYDIRKRLLDYEQIINFQRFLIYIEHKKILNTKNVRKEILIFGENLMYQFAKAFKKLKGNNAKLEFRKLENEISYLLNVSSIFSDYEEIKFLNVNEIYNILREEFWLTYDLKEQQLEILKPNIIRSLERKVLLKKIDLGWKSHLQKIEMLKEIIGWRGYGQFEPLSEYQNEGFKLFLETILEIQYTVIYTLLKLQINKY